MIQQLLCQIFSDQCQLTSLQLDITDSFYNIHHCLNLQFQLPVNMISTKFKSSCVTLRSLHVHLTYSSFLEDLIEYVPNLEHLSIHLVELQHHLRGFDSNTQSSIKSSGDWFNKVR